MEKRMTSGEIAKKTGVSQKTVRLYDEKGLLKPTGYSEGNYRLYDRSALAVLEKIIALKQIGFSLEEIHDFYHRFYHPSNAILSVSADIEPERVFELAEKWFGSIEDTQYPISAIPQEPLQTEARRKVVERDVPATTITIAFQMGDRLSRDFFLGDMTSDLLAGGDSARLYERLIKKKQLFASVNAYISGDVDRGMFVFTGQLHSTTTETEAEAAIWEEIEDLKKCNITAYELEKVKNKFEANTLFGELNVMNKAMNLGYYEMIGDLALINREVEIYRSLSAEDVADFSRRTFRPENSSTLIYRAK